MLTLHHQPPAFTEQEASRIATDLYGIDAVAALFPGEHDQNFHLKSAAGEEFVLKIAHAGEQRDILEAQNSVLQHLAARAPALHIPRLFPTLTGSTIAAIAGPGEVEHYARLLSYLPGKPLAHVNPHSPDLLRNLGHMLGSLDYALLDYEHPALHRSLKWDVPRVGWIREYLSCIDQPARGAMVEHFLAAFEQTVVPMLPVLRTSIIHNDGNDYNVLINRVSLDAPPSLSLVDFGDMVHTCTVCELAIAAAYVMMNKSDPLAAAALLIAGYHESFPLSEQELAVLFPLICARLCITVTNAAYVRHISPHNDYLQISLEPAWALLEQLVALSPAFAHYTFRAACDMAPCPQSEEIVTWLAEHPHEMGKLIEPDGATEKVVIFDLSVGSLLLGNQAEWSDVKQFTQKLFGRMRDAGATPGIGRYNEARPIYTGELFRAASNYGYEWRTVHLGLDLFVPPGSPVYAPLDGEVHSFANNDAALDYGPTIILQHTVTNTHDQPLTFYTLYGHLTIESLEGLYAGKPIARGMAFAGVGDSSVNGNWPPHLHFQIITDMLDKHGEFPGVARPSERDLWLSLSPDPNLVARIPVDCTPVGDMDAAALLEKRARHLGPSLSVSYRQPLKIVRGWRQYLYDQDGQPYLDGVNNVCHVGHSHPHVVQAGQEQMAVLNTNTRYLHEHLVHYAERLCAMLPEPLSVVYFVNSGSEANELALRLARTHTRRRDIIVVDVAYHGNTTSLIEISPYKYDGPGGFAPPPFVHKVPMPDVYRGEYKREDPDAGKRYASFVGEIIRQNGGTGAFICESLLSCGGQIILPDGYLKEAYRSVRAAGGVCIADEVQVGFGRAGTHFWGFETQGVVPDIVTMGKPIGNGHPLAAVVTTPEIAASFDNGMEYFNTFGGNPVSCAIGMAVLDVIETESLQANALHVGTHLMNGLHILKDTYPLIGDVRGLGLFIGVELVLDRETLAPAPAHASYIVNRVKERGILLSTDGPYHNVLKIKPPLVWSETDAGFLIDILNETLAEDVLNV